MTTATPQFIDSHAHLDFYQPEELANVLSRMRAASVATISIGTHSGDWPQIAEIARANPDVVLGHSVGLHPSEVKENWRDELRAMEQALSEGRPLCIGECGLDFFKLDEKPNAREVADFQRQAFAAQLSLIKSSGLGVQIHSRGPGAFAEIVAAIDRSGADWTKFVFHCFSEGPIEVRALNSRGARASFTGIITFKNGALAREALIAQGPELLILETDSPFLSPEPHRGTQNDPSRLPLVAQKAAELLGVEAHAFRAQLLKTTREFFGLKGCL